jgi:cobalt-zinc-cadmium efflux system membrane fusion protein
MNSRVHIPIGAIVLVGVVSGLWWTAADLNALAPPAARPGTVQENAGAVPGDLRVDGKHTAQLGIRLAPAVAAEDAPLTTVPAVIQ